MFRLLTGGSFLAFAIGVASVATAPADGRTVKGCVIKPRANCNGKSMARAPLAGADLRGGSFYFTYLVSADLRGANLSGARLTGANLSGADLRGADLRRANLSFARLVGAKMGGARLQGANLSFARMPNGTTHRAGVRPGSASPQ